ncbi:MAG: CTB family bacteriocin [Xenococcaceae cyanobacterium]
MNNEQIISDNSAIELSEEQLDGVAGGSGYWKRQYPKSGWKNNNKNINVNQNSNAVAFGGNANSSNNAVINA